MTLCWTLQEDEGACLEVKRTEWFMADRALPVRPKQTEQKKSGLVDLIRLVHPRSLWCLFALHPPPGEEKPLYAVVPQLNAGRLVGKKLRTGTVKMEGSWRRCRTSSSAKQDWTTGYAGVFMLSRWASAPFCRCCSLDAWAATACSCWMNSIGPWRRTRPLSSNCKAGPEVSRFQGSVSIGCQIQVLVSYRLWFPQWLNVVKSCQIMLFTWHFSGTVGEARAFRATLQDPKASDRHSVFRNQISEAETRK